MLGRLIFSKHKSIKPVKTSLDESNSPNINLKHDLPRIGITVGDAAGIGPEITLKAVSDTIVPSFSKSPKQKSKHFFETIVPKFFEIPADTIPIFSPAWIHPVFFCPSMGVFVKAEKISMLF